MNNKLLIVFTIIIGQLHFLIASPVVSSNSIEAIEKDLEKISEDLNAASNEGELETIENGKNELEKLGKNAFIKNQYELIDVPKLSREVREKKSNIDRYKNIIAGIMRKNSLYNTLPIDAELFNQYINEYVTNVDKRLTLNKLRQEPGYKLKRAACGNLNGSPMHRWICW